MFGPKVKLDAHLLKKAEARSQELGYSTVQEYISHLIEKDLKESCDDQAVEDRLKGLGYL